MTYSITVFHLGNKLQTYDGYEAPDAGVAIDRLIADKFTDMIETIYLFVSKDKPMIEIDWTGLEFEARRLGMELS